MAQLYFLSILFNIISGLALSMDYLSQRIKSLERIKDIFSGSILKVFVGVITLIIGAIKLFSPFPEAAGHQIPFVGDFFPMIAGISLGTAILLDFIKQKTDVPNASLEKIDQYFLNYKHFIGIGGILVSIIHFIFPGIIIL